MSWINRSWHTLLLLTLLPAGNPAPTRSTQAPPRLNVLFIAVDDLRPELGCYGSPIVQSPNIDSLAHRGIIFTRAYCRQAVCTPSRTSVLTGLRPDSAKVYNLRTHFRETMSNVITLPQYFKHQGYHTQSFGKVYHGGRMDDPQSWSAGSRQGEHETGEGVSWAAPEVADNALGDGKIADLAIEALRHIKDKPFFLGVGFRKPHLPFIAPRKYYDLYPPERIPRGKVMGSSMRAERYRYTEWAEPGQAPVGIELYDHRSDPAENVNAANLPKNKKLVAELSGKLRAGWRAALPPGIMRR